MVIWLKTPLPSEPTKGALTEEGAAMIRRFVDERFVKGLGIGAEKVQWFKNWTILQSVRAVDHVHVLLKDVTAEEVDRVVEPLEELKV